MMGQKLLAQAEAGEQFGSSQAPVDVHIHRVSAAAFRKSAGIVKDDRLCLASARDVLRRHAKEVIHGAFWKRSQHQTCVDAALACGTSPDTILRLLDGSTSAPDVLVLGYCAARYRQKTGIVSPICAVIASVIAAEISA